MMSRAKEFDGQFWAAALSITSADGQFLEEGTVAKGHPWAVQMQQDIYALGAFEQGEDLLLQADYKLGEVCLRLGKTSRRSMSACRVHLFFALLQPPVQPLLQTVKEISFVKNN